jgi:hypothetical protein
MHGLPRLANHNSRVPRISFTEQGPVRENPGRVPGSKVLSCRDPSLALSAGLSNASEPLDRVACLHGNACLERAADPLPGGP